MEENDLRPSGKKIIFGIIVLIVAFTIFIRVLTGISKSNQKQTGNIKTKQVSSNTMQTTVKKYSLGEIVDIGEWQITVISSEDKKTLKNLYGSKTTDNNYIVVKLKIKNKSNEARTLLTTATDASSIYTRSMLELYDGKATYVADYALEDYLDNDFDVFFSKINPNTTITYNAVFETDLLSTQKEYCLKLKDNNNILLKIK